jgi:hypothetical protein
MHAKERATDPAISGGAYGVKAGALLLVKSSTLFRNIS